MGKLKGPFEITGSVGNLTFVKTKYGIIVRQKSNVRSDRFAKDPAYTRQRQQMAEFAKASQAGKLLRHATRFFFSSANCSSLPARMTKEMLKVIQADPANPKGSRTVTAEGLKLLEGFEFNNDSRLENVAGTTFHVALRQIKGMNSDKLVLPEKMNSPANASHFEVVCSRICIDFNEPALRWRTEVRSEMLNLKNQMCGVVQLSSGAKEKTGLPIIVVMGVRFYQQVNGIYYAVSNGQSNALRVVRVL